MQQYVFTAKSNTLGNVCIGSFDDYGTAFEVAAKLAQTLYDEAITFEFHEVKGIEYAMQIMQQESLRF